MNTKLLPAASLLALALCAFPTLAQPLPVAKPGWRTEFSSSETPRPGGLSIHMTSLHFDDADAVLAASLKSNIDAFTARIRERCLDDWTQGRAGLLTFHIGSEQVRDERALTLLDQRAEAIRAYLAKLGVSTWHGFTFMSVERSETPQWDGVPWAELVLLGPTCKLRPPRPMPFH